MEVPRHGRAEAPPRKSSDWAGNLEFALGAEGVTTTLVGRASAAEVRANLRDVEAPLGVALLAEVQEVLSPVRGVTWSSGSEARPLR